MKKILLLLLGSAVLLLTACSNEAIHSSYSAYSHLTARQLYVASKIDLKKGKYGHAVKTLEALNALYPFGPYSEEASANLIYAYYKNDDPDSAMAAADRYLRLYPRGHYADYAYYMKGVVALRQGLTWAQRKVGVALWPRDLTNAKTAYASFNELVTAFPDSVYTPDAILRMRYIRNIFAKRDATTAEFYYKRKAYVAAINRASNVVEHYNHSPSVINALAILVKSYRKLGMTKKANDTLKIFQASYPNAPQLKALS